MAVHLSVVLKSISTFKSLPWTGISNGDPYGALTGFNSKSTLVPLTLTSFISNTEVSKITSLESSKLIKS